MQEDIAIDQPSIKEKVRTIRNPSFDYQNSASVTVLRITEEAELTRIDFVVYSKRFAWVNITPENFIRPVGTSIQLTMVQAMNIPVKPVKHWFHKRDQALYYILYFPPLPKDVKAIDIIEREVQTPGHHYFNFYGVSLERIATEIISVNNN
jgi:hypothetical protein